MTLLRNCFLSGMVALTLTGCSSTGSIPETTYQGDMETDSAVVQETPSGTYRTLSGDPYEEVDGDLERESMLPYGSGSRGIRRAEDEATPFQDQD